MKLIVTNDDGIEAQGLRTLADLASRWGEVVVVAPAEPQSGVGHQLTIDRPVRVDKLSKGRFRIWGTPADCARLALEHLVSDADWVLSGINHGGNLGVDVYESGTVAAAREAAIQGRRALALSHYVAEGRSIDWPLAAERLEPLLKRLLHEPLESGYFLSVNLPHPEHSGTLLETKQTVVDTSPYRNSFTPTEDGFMPTHFYHERQRQPGGDIDQCFNGHVTLSKIGV